MSAPQTSVQSTHPFTCNTCQVAFRSSELQRAHMQTDWHRYNLKRRVASLPPLSSEIFTEKVLANKASAAATAAKASFEKACQACQKTFYSENSYNNHLKSQKHKTNVAKAQRQGPIDDTASVMSSTFSLGDPVGAPPSLDGDAEQEFSKVVDGIKQTSLDDKEEPISRRPTRPHHSSAENRAEHPLSQSTTSSSASAADDRESVTSSTKPKIDPLLACLFCNYLSPSFQLNLHHMSRFHSMFLPEQDYLVDPEGLIKYLRSKIDDQHRCLYCNKAKHTASGIQTHMKDRGHSMIAFESENEALEVGDFYDFSSTWDDVEHFKAMQEEIEDVTDDSESTAGGGVKLSAPRKFTDSTNGIDEEEDDGWETDSTLSSVPTDEITSVPIDDRSHRYKLLSKSRHHTHGDPRPHRNADGFHSHAHTTPVAVYHDDYELHLPSGRTAGHRSLNRYFRQNLRNYPGVAERMESRRAITAGSSDSEGDVDMDRDHRQRGRQLITRANGGVGMIGVSDAKKAEVRKIEKKSRRDEQIARSRYQAGNEKRANQQKHFRDPLLQ